MNNVTKSGYIVINKGHVVLIAIEISDTNISGSLARMTFWYLNPKCLTFIFNHLFDKCVFM